ncbi:MAG: alpha/beta hydrolase [Chloroflexi bacterium]|nr:alpha/beta hydrolase [Chloroflexota bacterium]MCI0832908.1 alpha/beta hydrolase [Chloroflexota bacterium]MCI0886338.1 alpha/beta hydrolase [Chloroflexota bacterium]
MPPKTDGFHHEYASINGINYHYVREGSGPPLILVHGWPGFYYEWHRNIPELAKSFDVVAPDMRGYAYTDKPDVAPEEGYTPAVFAQDINALLDHLGWDKANFVAHDFGAVWVQEFARTYRDRVDKLVMFNPPYAGIGMRWMEMKHIPEIWYQTFHQLPWAEDIVTSSREATRLYISHFLSHWSHDKAIWADDEIEEFVEAFSQPGAVRGGFNCYRAVFRTRGQSSGGDPKIHAPTLILWGADDAVLPLAWSDKLDEFFPNLTFRKVENAGHWIMRELPDLVNESITEFVLKGTAQVAKD